MLDEISKCWAGAVQRLGDHLLAAFCAGAAGPDASVHVADALTLPGTVFADVGAFLTEMFVVRRADQHDMGSGTACLGAGEHELDVIGPRVFAPNL